MKRAELLLNHRPTTLDEAGDLILSSTGDLNFSRLDNRDRNKAVRTGIATDHVQLKQDLIRNRT